MIQIVNTELTILCKNCNSPIQHRTSYAAMTPNQIVEVPYQAGLLHCQECATVHKVTVSYRAEVEVYQESVISKARQ